MKVIAMYLPQFHQVKENDEWWGEGFTEWTAVRNAHKYYKEHKQPRVPLNENYYNLLDKRTMEWQSSLMKKYEIDGLCMYHYWFKNGRKILERPAENLLQWEDIHMPYCFCWANETWARSWANISGANCWCDTGTEKTKDGKAILLEQKYGNKSDWKEHFEYLLPFFKDKRYLRLDENPIFVFYKPEEIPCLTQMLEYWRKLAKSQGLKGIYGIGANLNNGIKYGLDAELYHQPRHTMEFLKGKKAAEIKTFEYEKIWEYILSEEAPSGQNVIYGGFVDYDDTPRRGKKGTSVLGTEPVKFQKYLTRLIVKNAQRGNPLVFINAWNEWGEGMYLEPDQKNHEAFLKAVKRAKDDANTCFDITGKYTDEIDKIKSILSYTDKIDQYFATLDKWLTLKEQGKYLEDYFRKNNIKNIAVYGYGILGKHLVEELHDSDITVKYIIDERALCAPYGIDMIKPEDNIQDLNVIVVTAYYFLDEIVEVMAQKGNYKIVSLKTIIDEMLN